MTLKKNTTPPSSQQDRERLQKAFEQQLRSEKNRVGAIQEHFRSVTDRAREMQELLRSRELSPAELVARAFSDAVRAVYDDDVSNSAKSPEPPTASKDDLDSLDPAPLTDPASTAQSRASQEPRNTAPPIWSTNESCRVIEISEQGQVQVFQLPKIAASVIKFLIECSHNGRPLQTETAIRREVAPRVSTRLKKWFSTPDGKQIYAQLIERQGDSYRLRSFPQNHIP